MKTLIKRRDRIIRAIGRSTALSNWNDWRWQVRHCLRDPKTMAEVLGVPLDQRMREDLERTVRKFPMSITPYSS